MLTRREESPGRLLVLAVGAMAIVLTVPAPSSAQDAEPLEKQIDQAIVKGVDWLKKQQKPDGAFTDSGGPAYVPGPGAAHVNRAGNTALTLLALLKSEVDPAELVITKGFAWLTAYFPAKENLRTNYEMAASLMAVEALYEARIVAKMKKSGQKVKERAGDFKEPKYSLSPQDSKLVADLVSEMTGRQSKRGGWRYGPGMSANAGDEDMSATQVVLLGLKSATRMKAAVQPAVFQKALTYVLEMQEKDGPAVERPKEVTPKPGDRGTFVTADKDRARGWPYMTTSNDAEETLITGGMTCAGITSILIIKSVIGKTLSKELNTKAEQAIYDGFAWIYTHWDVGRNPGRKRSHKYYLYGLERIGTLGCFERICNHVWFREGAEVLVQGQKGEGFWDDREIDPPKLYATCFALLFLKRGTVPIGDVMTGSGR